MPQCCATEVLRETDNADSQTALGGRTDQHVLIANTGREEDRLYLPNNSCIEVSWTKLLTEQLAVRGDSCKLNNG